MTSNEPSAVTAASTDAGTTTCSDWTALMQCTTSEPAPKTVPTIWPSSVTCRNLVASPISPRAVTVMTPSETEGAMPRSGHTGLSWNANGTRLPLVSSCRVSGHAMAMEWRCPDEMRVEPPVCAGTSTCPYQLLPHAVTRPSLSSATVWRQPAVMSITPMSPAGTIDWPESLDPHARTMPSPVSATVWRSPAATFTMPVSPCGTWHWPCVERPQHRTVPQSRSAATCAYPAAA